MASRVVASDTTVSDYVVGTAALMILPLWLILALGESDPFESATLARIAIDASLWSIVLWLASIGYTALSAASLRLSIPPFLHTRLLLGLCATFIPLVIVELISSGDIGHALYPGRRMAWRIGCGLALGASYHTIDRLLLGRCARPVRVWSLVLAATTSIASIPVLPFSLFIALMDGEAWTKQYLLTLRFDRERWLSAEMDDDRLRMVESLIDRHGLVGFSRSAIDSLLGPASIDTALSPSFDVRYHYMLGSRGMDYVSLGLRCDSTGRVIRYDFVDH